MIRGRKGQSELIGTVLMIAVVVLAASMIGFFMLEQQSNQIQNQEPTATFETEFNTSTLRISHAGADSFALSDLELVIRGDTERRYDLSDPNERLTDTLNSNDKFDPGESITVSHSFSTEVEILLIDTSEGGYVLYDIKKSPSTPTPTPTATLTPTPSPTPGGTASPTPGGTTASIDAVRDKSECSDISGASNNCKNKANTDVARFEVDYSVAAANNIDSVQIYLNESNSNKNVITKSPSASGSSASGTVTLEEQDRYGEEFKIVVKVTDSSGGAATDTRTVTADGTS